MRMLNIKSVIFLLCIFLFTGCKSNKQLATFYNYETECQGSGLDGSQTITSYGTGLNGKEAITQSLKNGMRDVILKGTRSNNTDCNLKPIVPEVNAKDKYENYFNSFFSPNGEYLKYIGGGVVSKKIPTKVSNNGAPKVIYKTTFHVLRADLRNKMLVDGILHD